MSSKTSASKNAWSNAAALDNEIVRRNRSSCFRSMPRTRVRHAHGSSQLAVSWPLVVPAIVRPSRKADTASSAVSGFIPRAIGPRVWDPYRISRLTDPASCATKTHAHGSASTSKQDKAIQSRGAYNGLEDLRCAFPERTESRPGPITRTRASRIEFEWRRVSKFSHGRQTGFSQSNSR